MSESNTEGRLSYREAGVDIAEAERFVSGIAQWVRQTHGPSVVHHPSGYAGLFRLDAAASMKDPMLAVTCDGVGTKLLVARETGRYKGLGQDLVAMSVNDLLPLAARPLLFLDYIATGKLDAAAMEQVVYGIATACRSTGCALLGGETAEMPGVYAPGDFDLAGFAVGLVDGVRLPDPKSMGEGDVVLGLPSTGIHSNGLSLARAALFERGGASVSDRPAPLAGSLGEELLKPTALYVQEVQRLLEHTPFKAAAHVTGGGLLGRAKQLLPEGLRMHLDHHSFTVPPIFELIAQAGGVCALEMASTFNMGLGFLVVLGSEQAHEVHQTLGEQWIAVGRLQSGERGVEFGDVSI